MTPAISSGSGINYYHSVKQIFPKFLSEGLTKFLVESIQKNVFEEENTICSQFAKDHNIYLYREDQCKQQIIIYTHVLRRIFPKENVEKHSKPPHLTHPNLFKKQWDLFKRVVADQSMMNKILLDYIAKRNSTEEDLEILKIILSNTKLEINSLRHLLSLPTADLYFAILELGHQPTLHDFHILCDSAHCLSVLFFYMQRDMYLVMKLAQSSYQKYLRKKFSLF